ncbi:MAG: DUF3987 domain-containing protein [Planctomycetes bacterium]|nr:DUF3987 domain-containing protein [Planctomycetota bacterium]
MTVMNPQLQSVLDRLERVKQTGSGYSAQCPAHDDNRNSLSISIGDDGRVLLHCFAECSVDAVCAGIELGKKDLFGPKSPSSQRREVAHYNYTDESGNLLFQKVRYEPKDFLCRVPDGAGGWAYKLNGVRCVLYRLPDVIKSPVVFVCEGEKDCDLLAQHGYTATCNYDGAGKNGKKWKSEYNPFFTNKAVFILPDNDGPGRKHTATIYEGLKDIATDCRIVELPGLPDKGDASYWFANGGTVEQFNLLLTDAPEGLPESFAFTESTDSTVKPHQPFPVDCIPEPGQTLIRNIAESVNVDISFPAAAYLAVCAGLIGASRKVQIKRGWYEPSIIWAAIIGRPSSGKTPAIDTIIEPLKSIEKRKIEAFEAELKTYENEKAAQKKDDPQLIKPVCKRTVISDTTTEALCLRLKENPQGLLLYRDELAGWIGSFNQYKKSGSDEAHFLSIWSGKAVRVDRKTDEQFLYIENPNLSIVGGIQPGILRRKLRGEHLDNGLAQRFLYVFPDVRVRGWTDAAIDGGVIQQVQMIYERLLNLMSENEPENQLVRLSSDAQNIIRNYCNILAIEIDTAKDVTAEALGKLPGYLARIALVLHELKNAETWLSDSEKAHYITPETMNEAAKITNWFKDESIRVFDYFSDDSSSESGGLQNPVHKQIETWLGNRINDNPELAETLQAEAEEKNFSWVYVQKIAKDIGIKKVKSREHGGKYVWSV